jgi:RNA polymerase sigma-70 factor (ECF subfamily)
VENAPARATVLARRRRRTVPTDEAHCHDSDAELVRRIHRGDDTAFQRLVDRHGPRLLRLATWMLGNAADAEDVVQETLAAAFRGLGGFRGRSSVKTWLSRILIKRVARLRRYRRVRRALSLEQVLGRAGAASSRGPAETARADVRMDVAAVLTKLSQDHRSVIVLREMQGMSYEEMSEVLAVPRGTVESRLFRARQKLRELLKDYLP